ncbi:glycosyltransferase family 2 protein [Flavobacterium orientale]|uniref:Glycosyl transferase n=1 Tax=Flavobacterium orientale TaxID=1756020 RepID=A0A916Y0V1_9FLAO|nr:glycosyltransferase family 2 protein [Flavobacterium orientale]GGD25816.1 glycosyl transferase [Flavobacterium orientale]
MLSILIPTYNYNVQPLVLELQKQAEALSFVYEIIVCDDASNTSQNITIDSNQSIHFIKNETNLGRTQTRQKLALKAKFENLLFLDADVLPKTTTFVKEYFTILSQSYEVICGGCTYEKNEPSKKCILRWKYGKNREEKSALQRNIKPYSAVFSGNLLIKKSVFLKYNFNENTNFYGMDIYFAYQLFFHAVSVKHYDVDVIHLGLESNEVFFKKSLESVVSRNTFLIDKPKIEEINSLIKHYKTLKKFKLDFVFSVKFKLFKSLLEKNILGNNPNLFLFDLYRLGYLCSLQASK